MRKEGGGVRNEKKGTGKNRGDWSDERMRRNRCGGRNQREYR